MPAPTIQRNAQPTPGTPQRTQGGQAPSAAPIIPFTRAARKKSRLISTIGPTTLTTGVQNLAAIQVPAAGYLRRIRLQVAGTTAGNAAAVAFQPDAPFNILSSITLLAANGDSLISPIDGFMLYVLNKYGVFSRSVGFDPVLDSTFSATTGAGATGGSFNFNIEIPFELDARDALCALANMAANQSFLLQLSLNTIANVYSTAPTSAPTIVMTLIMDYWSAPADSNGAGVTQATAPPGNGSVSIIQTQTPPIVASADVTIQSINVGNTLRVIAFILRTAAGVRTSADWPTVFSMFVNNDPWYYKTKNNFIAEMAERYKLRAASAANVSSAGGAIDQGVFILSEFISDGTSGDNEASATCNRNLWLPTNSSTALAFQFASFGASANQLQILTNSVRPSDPSAIYQPFLI